MDTNQNSNESQPKPADAPVPPAPVPLPPDLLAFAPVPVRYRHDGWTPDRQRGFIEELADCLSPEIAAQRVGMSVQSAYRLRRRAGAEGFSAAWDAALIVGLRHKVPATALDMALNGRVVRRYYHGKLVAEERVFSEKLLLLLLQKGDRLFPEKGASRTILADWDGAMAQLGEGRLESAARVWIDRDGIWMTDFPPPRGFDSYSEGAPGMPGYRRCLTEAEQRSVEAQRSSWIADGEAARDLYFGFTPRNRRIDRESRLG